MMVPVLSPDVSSEDAGLHTAFCRKLCELLLWNADYIWPLWIFLTISRLQHLKNGELELYQTARKTVYLLYPHLLTSRSFIEQKATNLILEKISGISTLNHFPLYITVSTLSLFIMSKTFKQNKRMWNRFVHACTKLNL